MIDARHVVRKVVVEWLFCRAALLKCPFWLPVEYVYIIRINELRSIAKLRSYSLYHLYTRGQQLTKQPRGRGDSAQMSVGGGRGVVTTLSGGGLVPVVVSRLILEALDLRGNKRLLWILLDFVRWPESETETAKRSALFMK